MKIERFTMPEGPVEYFTVGARFALEMFAMEVGFLGVYVVAIGGCYLVYRVIRALLK